MEPTAHAYFKEFQTSLVAYPVKNPPAMWETWI